MGRELETEVEKLRGALIQITHAYYAAHITYGIDPSQSAALRVARDALAGIETGTAETVKQGSVPKG